MNESLLDFWENFLEPNVAMKSDLDKLATKNELQKVADDLNKIATDVKDIKRRVLEIEADAPTRSEFSRLKTRLDLCCPEN
jgi:hypothetical protein